MKKMTPEELEKIIHRQLRGLPARRAPDTLESRVRSAIEQRATIPWHHKSWSYWPVAIRASFLVFATGVAGAAVAGFHFGFNVVEASAVFAEAGQQLSFFTKSYHVASWTADLGAQVFGSIPTLLSYCGLTVIGLLYVVFFGLWAAAYRTLYRSN